MLDMTPISNTIIEKIKRDIFLERVWIKKSRKNKKVNKNYLKILEIHGPLKVRIL